MQQLPDDWESNIDRARDQLDWRDNYQRRAVQQQWRRDDRMVLLIGIGLSILLTAGVVGACKLLHYFQVW